MAGGRLMLVRGEADATTLPCPDRCRARVQVRTPPQSPRRSMNSRGGRGARLQATKERLERSRAAEEGGDTVQLPTETSPYVRYDGLEDYKMRGYGAQGHLPVSDVPHGGSGTDAPTVPGTAVPDDVQQRDLGGLGGGTKDSAGRRRGDAATDVINRHGVPLGGYRRACSAQGAWRASKAPPPPATSGLQLGARNHAAALYTHAGRFSALHLGIVDEDLDVRACDVGGYPVRGDGGGPLTISKIEPRRHGGRKGMASSSRTSRFLIVSSMASRELLGVAASEVISTEKDPEAARAP
ncbi:hypothetical protein HU200_037908 [Digitaria exilis]|uniref:Uncharacterized protein n=1 Tax=Digitaria exilis TaxID=1010633 RepID=A0A835BPN5_9POAL|nr:hypothetical protein HU200_037908 [Digitaria exilis]